MYIHQSLKGNMIAQDSECPSLMVKPTFCGQTRKVGNVPEADLRMTAQSANSPPIPIRAWQRIFPELSVLTVPATMRFGR